MYVQYMVSKKCYTSPDEFLFINHVLVRSRDKSTAVRLEVADCCATILKKRANYLKIIEGDNNKA